MIKAVLFDFGGVLTTSPFEAFARYEAERGLPHGFIRSVNAADPHSNAWARLERGQLDLEAFDRVFADEAEAAGHRVPGRDVLALLQGDLRPEMITALRWCSARYVTACLTNNFSGHEEVVRPEVEEVLALFDRVFESRVLGIRKPEPRFYELACAALGVSPNEAAFLDDLGVNLKPARAMGMRTIKVERSDQALRELSTLTGMPFPPVP